MTAAALLQANQDPSPEEIRFALKDTLCRCAAYPTIERAVLSAARSLRTGQPIEPPELPPCNPGRWASLTGSAPVIRPDVAK
jgi:hypothetical protein